MSDTCPDCAQSLKGAPVPGGKDWEPDTGVVDAILAGSATVMADLSGADRAWAVAGLVRAGLTREDIADRLRCSVRLVHAVATSPATAVCSYLMDREDVWSDENRLAAVEIRVRASTPSLRLTTPDSPVPVVMMIWSPSPPPTKPCSSGSTCALPTWPAATAATQAPKAW